jgi:hypothetical protein
VIGSLCYVSISEVLEELRLNLATVWKAANNYSPSRHRNACWDPLSSCSLARPKYVFSDPSINALCWWDESDGPQFPMTDMHLVADVCGDCFLERWQFGKDMILSNGYSIAMYPTDALSKFELGMGLSKVEKTWGETRRVEESVNRGADHDIGRTRPMLELEKEKVQYRFLHAIPFEGGIRQFYYHYGLEGDHDTLVELLWTQKDTIG